LTGTYASRDDAAAPRRIYPRRDFSELKLNVGQAAKILDVRRATLSDLVNGKAALKFALGAVFWVSWHVSTTMPRSGRYSEIMRFGEERYVD
jgi:hypothetical protein